MQWLMHGTNTGPWNGQPPTGRPVAMRGVDVFTVAAGKNTSAEGYFDRQAMAEQLGFQMRPLPPMAGSFQFGYAVRASAGSRTVPGAFNLTWIDARSEAEAEEVKLTAAVVAAELSEEPGFLSWVGMEIGSRLYTITAWESDDAVRAVMRNSTHLGAVKRLLTEDFAAAAGTGVWCAHHLNPVQVRCTSCARLADPVKSGGRCACGKPLPLPEYW
jgi:heme-degrading monooxygenase HmoA